MKWLSPSGGENFGEVAVVIWNPLPLRSEADYGIQKAAHSHPPPILVFVKREEADRHLDFGSDVADTERQARERGKRKTTGYEPFGHSLSHSLRLCLKAATQIQNYHHLELGADVCDVLLRQRLHIRMPPYEHHRALGMVLL